jgi:restriction endonuclease S subunit
VLTGRVTIGKLALERIERIQLLVPDWAQQREFAEHVSDIQAIISQQERMAEASEQLVAALMAQLFDGG